MRKTIMICDRCGNEYKQTNNSKRGYEVVRFISEEESESMDFCGNCYLDLCKFIKEKGHAEV